MRDKTEYMVVEFSKATFIYGIIASIFIVLGLFSFVTLEHEGHWLTGMNNQFVWGLPCLLYTSPSPRDKRLSRLPSSA